MTNPPDQPDPTSEGPDLLWAPWRLEYLESLDDDEQPKAKADPQPTSTGRPKTNPAGFLADYWESPDKDEEHHVLVRSEQGMILLNRYPYANGHLLVALGEPRPRLLDYNPNQRAALWQLVDRAMDLMERALHPQGVNVGINQGRAAGAGVPGHLHAHLVPRWNGDVNFMTTIAGLRVIPSSLDAMRDRYRRAIEADG